MAVCSFLGAGNVYESDLPSKLVITLERIIAENNDVEFLFFHHNYGLEKFSDLCLKVATEMRAKYPEKVTIIFVHHGRNYESKKLFRYWLPEQQPAYTPDKMITSDVLNSENSIARYKYQRRRMIDLSTHIVSYVYEKFFDTERSFLRIAKRRTNLELIDITSDLTMQTISEGILSLSDREQFVFQKLDEGYTHKDVATLLKVSAERVRQLELRIGGKLRRYALSRNRPNPCLFTPTV